MFFYTLFLPLIELSTLNSYASMDRGLDSILDDLENIKWFDYEKKEIKDELVFTNKIELYIDEDDLVDTTEIDTQKTDDSEKSYYINYIEDNEELKEFEELELKCKNEEKSEILLDLFLLKKIKTLNLPNEERFIEAISLTYKSFFDYFVELNPKNINLLNFKVILDDKLKTVIILFYKKMCYDSNLNLGEFNNILFNDGSLKDVINIMINLLEGKESQREIVNQFKLIITNLKDYNEVKDKMRSYLYLYEMIYYNYFVTNEIFNFLDETEPIFRVCNNMNKFLENLFYCVEVKIQGCLSSCLYSIKLSDEFFNTSFVQDTKEKILYLNVNYVFKLIYNILWDEEDQ